MPSHETTLLVCHDCDAAQVEPVLPPGGAARCFRCAGVLHRAPRYGVDQALALTIAGALFLMLAHAYAPIIVRMQGQFIEPNLVESAWLFYERDMPLLTALVFLGIIVLPILQTGIALYLLVLLWLGQIPPAVGPVFRLLHALRPWSQLDILLLGVLVAITKLREDFETHVGLGTPFLTCAIVLPLVGGTVLEPRTFWRHVEALRGRLAAGMERAQ